MTKIVILVQSKLISLYLKIKKNKKFKNQKFVNCPFIIHKNRNKTGIQPILISNSTSVMFNKIFCEMKGRKVIHWGGRNGGTVQIDCCKCDFGIYLDIQEYYFDIQGMTTLVCLLLVLYELVPSIHYFF